MKKILIYACAICATLSIADGLTDLQRRYVRQRTRIAQRDAVTIPGYVINTFRRGDETWQTTNKLAVITTAQSLRISKYSLIRNLKDLGKWQVVKSFIIDSGIEDEWNACSYVSTDDPLYISATNSAVQAGLATSEEIGALILDSVDR